MKPSEQEYKDLSWLLRRLQISEDYCRPYFDRAKRHYRLYRFGSAVDEDKWPYVNRSYTRDILAFIEDTTALMVQTLFATMPFFSAIPRVTQRMQDKYGGTIDPLKIARQIEKCVDYQVSHEDTEFFAEIVDYFKGGAMLGNSYVGIYPNEPNSNYLHPLMKVHDFWDVLPIPYARRLTKARGVYVREFQSIEDLKEEQKKGIYKNVNEIKSIEGSEEDPEKSWHTQLLKEVGLENWLPSKTDVEVIHYLSGGHIITFADRKRILRDSNNSDKPFPYDHPVVQYKYMPVPLEFFGMGIPEVLETLQEDHNLIRSARRDNMDLCINKIIKWKKGTETDPSLLQYYAGAIWPHESLNDTEPLEIGDVTQSAYMEEERRIYDKENALSLFGYARGMTPRHSEQPTTVIKLQQASLNRTDLAVKLAEFTSLQNIASRIILLTRKYMPQEVYEDIIGEADAGFYKLEPEDIKRFYYIQPVGSSVTHIKEIRQAQIKAAIEMLSVIPPEMAVNNITPFTVDWYEALYAGLDSVDIKSRDRILVKKPQEEAPMEEGMGMEMLPMAEELAALGNVPYGGE